MAVTETGPVLAVLEQFRLGWEALDADAVLGCFARDPDIVVNGTDGNERWRGYDALVEPFRTMVRTFTDLDYRWQAPPHIVVEGRVAWADAVLDTRLTDAAGERLAVTMRTTWVLRRTERWEVVQAHFSVAPPAPVAAY
jgi:ketosteroid isomerase-like protein